MESKLNLDLNLVAKARESSKNIAQDTQKFIDRHTTVAVERTVCRLLGIDGVDEFGVPLPNVVVENIKAGNGLSVGVAVLVGNAMVNTGLTPQEIAEKVAKNELDLTKLPMKDMFEIKMAVEKVAKNMVATIKANRGQREAYLEKFGDKTGPYLYVIVATGNIYEDIFKLKLLQNKVQTL